MSRTYGPLLEAARIQSEINRLFHNRNIQFKAFELEITNNGKVGAPPYRVRALQSF